MSMFNVQCSMFQGTTLTPLLSIEHSSLSIDPLPFVKKAAAVARKPNSVRLRSQSHDRELRRDDHSSSPAIAGGIKRPTRKLRTGRSDSASLFGLAPCGVLPATRVATGAVRSYRTFSPLPLDSRAFARSLGAVYFLCHFPSGYPDRALPGALPCGVRTFLSPSRPSGATAQQARVVRYDSAALRRRTARSARGSPRRSARSARRRAIICSTAAVQSTRLKAQGSRLRAKAQDLNIALSHQPPVRFRIAPASCTDCCAACRSLPPSLRCSNCSRGVCRRGTSAQRTP
jgi:hypothetical protein